MRYLLLLLPFVIGCAEEIPTAPTSAKPTRLADAPAAGLSGTINGVPVEGFRGFLENGSFLSIYTGDDPNFEYGTRLLLFTDLETPAGQQREFDPSMDFGAWHIHVDSKEHEGLSHMAMNGYRMQFETGEESDFTVRAKIDLELDGEFPIRLRGTVDVKTSGLVSRDGVIDLGHDHMDTIEYVAKNYLTERHGRLEFRDPQNHMMANATDDAERKQEAYYAALYTDADGELKNSKLQLAKLDGAWRVVEELAPNQIRVAHPINPPHRDRPPYIYDRIAAAEFERTIYALPDAWRRIKEPSFFSCGGGQRDGSLGFCKVSYGVYTDETLENYDCEQVTYIFEPVDGDWKMSTLPAGQAIDPRTGEIAERDDPPFGC